jgi:hypothetical protein
MAGQHAPQMLQRRDSAPIRQGSPTTEGAEAARSVTAATELASQKGIIYSIYFDFAWRTQNCQQAEIVNIPGSASEDLQRFLLALEA